MIILKSNSWPNLLPLTLTHTNTPPRRTLNYSGEISCFLLLLCLSYVAQASLVAQMVKKLQETGVRSLGQEDPQKKEMATHSSILAWRMPWTEELGGLQSTGSQRVGHALTFLPRVLVTYKSWAWISLCGLWWVSSGWEAFGNHQSLCPFLYFMPLLFH